MTVEINYMTDDMDDVASKIREEFDMGAVAIQATDQNRVMGGFDREGWMFADMIGAVEFMKQKWINNH